jgi:hypothetical protein
MFPLKPEKILKQQSSSSTIQYNGQVATQRQNIQTQGILLPNINFKKWKEKGDSIEDGADYEHQKAKDYFTHQHRNSNNSRNNNKNDCFQTFLLGLTPTESTDYSLWKATKKIKQAKKPSPPFIMQ